MVEFGLFGLLTLIEWQVRRLGQFLLTPAVEWAGVVNVQDAPIDQQGITIETLTTTPLPPFSVPVNYYLSSLISIYPSLFEPTPRHLRVLRARLGLTPRLSRPRQ